MMKYLENPSLQRSKSIDELFRASGQFIAGEVRYRILLVRGRRAALQPLLGSGNIAVERKYHQLARHERRLAGIRTAVDWLRARIG